MPRPAQCFGGQDFSSGVDLLELSGNRIAAWNAFLVTERLFPLFIGYPSLVRGYDMGSFSVNECVPSGASDCPAFDRLLVDYLVTAAASCAVAILHDYAELLRDEPAWQARAERLAARTLDLVSFLATPAGGRGRAAGPVGGRGAGPVGSGAPPELVVGSGSVWTRPEPPGGRGRGVMAYPEGTPDYTRYTINEYNTVGNRIKPPFTTIVKYDLNAPAIKWRVPFGDDPALAARGVTGTGAPAVNNSIVVTESGLLFGAGLDNHIRAWDTETGKELWASRFGGSFSGSPVMYMMDGKQYLLVAAASTAGRGVGAAPGATPAAPAAPMGWVAYALPGR